MTVQRVEGEYGEKPDVALFIDWENFKIGLTRRREQPNVTALMEAVEEHGRVVVARAYADWGDYFHLRSHDQQHLYHAGIEPVYVPSRPDPSRSERRKNSVDVKLCADCMEVSFTSPHIRTYVLVSGDADFLHVTNLLRSRGKRVVVFGVTGSTSDRISDRVDELIYFDQISRRPAFLPRPAGGGREAEVEAVLEVIVELVRAQRQQGRYPLLSWLGSQLRQRIKEFNHLNYGFAKFKDLMSVGERRGLVKVVTRDLVDWAALPEDDIESDMPAEREDPEPPAPSDGADVPDGGVSSAESADTDPACDAAYEGALPDVVWTLDELERDPRYAFVAAGLLQASLLRKMRDDGGALPAGARPASPALKALRPAQLARLLMAAAREGVVRRERRGGQGFGPSVLDHSLERGHPLVRHLLQGAEAFPSTADEAIPAPPGEDDPLGSTLAHHGADDGLIEEGLAAVGSLGSLNGTGPGAGSVRGREAAAGAENETEPGAEADEPAVPGGK